MVRKYKLRPRPTTRVDRFSVLPVVPDEVAHHILAFVEFIDLVRVSTVSKRCRRLYLSIPSLELNQYDLSARRDRDATESLTELSARMGQEEVELLNHMDRYFFNRGDNRIQHFRIRWSLDRKSSHKHIQMFVMPSDVLVSQSLGSLSVRLQGVTLQAPSLSLLCNLHYLKLTEIKIVDESFFKWISCSCKSIKELQLDHVRGLPKITIESSSLKSFKVWSKDMFHLNIFGEKIEDIHITWRKSSTPPSRKWLNISAPNLKNLKWEGNLMNIQNLGNLMSLEKAVVFLESAVNEFDNVFRVICSIRRAKVVILNEWTINKGFVKNRAKSEGSIANAYIAHECVTYCKSYLHNTDGTKGLDPARTPTFNLSIVSEDIRMFGNLPNSEILREDELCEAHWWVLQHCDKVKEYIDAHLGLIQLKYQNRHEERHKKTFPVYFLKWVTRMQERQNKDYSPQLHHLACMPQGHNVYAACVVNGVKFLRERRDQRRKTQNSGIMVVVRIMLHTTELLLPSSNPAGMPVVLFKCRWFNTDPNFSRSMKMDHGLLSVNTSTSWYEHAPFVLAIQAKQVFYLNDPKAGGGWKVVNVMEHRSIFNATTLQGGQVEQNIENMALKPYQEPLNSDIPDTSTIRINNDIHFLQGEYIPISGLEFDFGSLPYIPPSHDFINDEDEDEDEIPEDDLEDPDYEDSD
uniref:uncharacterized protein LOC105352639 n=1 Tax=Fragaria vesca subsp. vesca TaxID=101020 RepID=UPI0005C88387|nr:PREDICTED: uncharacterized protein LOC105352639 [Fragaria vesca subsp. vesca]